MSHESAPNIHKPNGYLWTRVSGQVAAKSLEWIHWGNLLSMAEFNTKKGTDGLTDRTLVIDKDGSLKTSNEYDQISPGPISYQLRKLPYLLKISKIRGIIYGHDGVCAIHTYKLWRNLLYEAGYSGTLLIESNRHMAIQELETIGRYFRNIVVETSSQTQISAQNAMGQCLHDPSLMVELLPKIAP